MSYEEIAEARGWAEAYDKNNLGFAVVCVIVVCIILAIIL
jgi:hypothetical protein